MCRGLRTIIVHGSEFDVSTEEDEVVADEKEEEEGQEEVRKA